MWSKFRPQNYLNGRIFYNEFLKSLGRVGYTIVVFSMADISNHCSQYLMVWLPSHFYFDDFDLKVIGRYTYKMGI
jgi:hypothetical protein